MNEGIKGVTKPDSRKPSEGNPVWCASTNLVSLAMSAGHFNPARRDRLTACSAKKSARTNGQYLTDKETKLALQESGPFMSWLQSFLSTSQKSYKGASRVVQGLYRFYKFADSCFLEPLPDLVKNTPKVNDWLVSLKDLGIGPSGIQSLLKSLILYLDWLQQQQAATRDERASLEDVKAIYTMISRRLNKEKKTQVIWHREEEADCSWSDIVSAYNEAEKRAIERLQPALQKTQMTAEDVVLLRRTLMIGIVRANALRESAVYGMTIGEAEAGLQNKKENGAVVIRVHDHKTGRTSGSVEIHLGAHLTECFAVYLTCRKEVKALPNDRFFSQGGSKPMTTSLAIEFKNLSKAVNMSDIPSPTIFRKAVQSLAPVKTQKDREALAGLLHHSPGVAMLHYRRDTAADRQASRHILAQVLAMGKKTSHHARGDQEEPPSCSHPSGSIPGQENVVPPCSVIGQTPGSDGASVLLPTLGPLDLYAIESGDDTDTTSSE